MTNIKQMTNKNTRNHQNLSQNASQDVVDVLVVAAGTGGHVFPALAVARSLMEQGIKVAWLGTPQGMEVDIVQSQKILYHSIQIRGLRGNGIMGLLGAPFKVLRACFQSLAIIRKLRPNVVLAMGGYVAGPAGVATRLMGIPLVIHEQNAIPGLTNQLLASISQKVFSAFPNELQKFPSFRCIGNPLRADILQAAKKLSIHPKKTESLEGAQRPLRLLILGGSLGARSLNQWVPQALAKISPSQRPEVWHQAGKKHLADAQRSYEQSLVKVRLVDFIDQMSEAYAWADLVFCRSGALTVSEVSAMAVPAIFFPYPFAVDDHQTANADYLVRIGGAEVIQETAVSVDLIAEKISFYLQAPEQLQLMREKIFANRRLGATEELVEYLQDL